MISDLLMFFTYSKPDLRSLISSAEGYKVLYAFIPYSFNSYEKINSNLNTLLISLDKQPLKSRVMGLLKLMK